MAGEIVTPDQSSQTNVKRMGSISILLVDDDTTCLAIVAAILKTWKYDVVTVKHPMEALCTLRGSEGTFDLVITDVHMPDMNGFQLQKKIDEEFNLPVVFMSADDQESVMLRGLQSGAAFFLLKPISPNDLKNLWQYAVAKRKPKSASTAAIEITPETSQAAGKQATNDPGRYPVQGTSEYEKSSNEEVGSGSSLRIEDRKDTNYSKRKYLVNFDQDQEENEDDYGNPKKPKVVWTNALHNQFLEAIRCVGIERAVPKKILELMNVPGLTRENIASHLQKYRIFLKRVSEASTKIQTASERSMIERTFRSNFAAAQPYLKPNFSAAQLGKSLQANLSANYSNPPKFASTTHSPPMFGSGQSRLLLHNQTNFKHPLVGSSSSTTAKPLYQNYQPNFSPLRMEPTVHPTTAGLFLNGNYEKNSGGILGNFVQPYQQKDFVGLDHQISCPNDPVAAGYGINIGDFGSSTTSNLNHMSSNAGYVGYRLASDGRLVGLSADLNPGHASTNVVQSESTTGNVPIQELVGILSDEELNNPNHGFQSESIRNVPIQIQNVDPNYHGCSINVVQSGSSTTCHVGALNDSFDDYLGGQGASSTGGLESGCFVLPTLEDNNVIQDAGNTSAMPSLSPSILGENAFEINEGEISDCLFSLLDHNNNVLINSTICEVDDGNPNFLQQTYGKCDFDILSDINIIQPPIQDDVEVIDHAFSSSPDDHAENIPIANHNQCLEQHQLGREMMFSDLGMDGIDDYFQAYDQTFDQTFPQLEDEDFLDAALFGTSEFNGYNMP